jgi:hypothetical protein
MKKIVIGNVYRAHGFGDGIRITSNGRYHFKILESKNVYLNGKRQNIYLGLKLDVFVSPFDSESQCFWFDENGVYESGWLRFELKRKINKS